VAALGRAFAESGKIQPLGVCRFPPALSARFPAIECAHPAVRRTELALPLFSLGGMRYSKSWVICPLIRITAHKPGTRFGQPSSAAVAVGMHHIRKTAPPLRQPQKGQLLALARGARTPSASCRTKVPPNPDPAVFEAETGGAVSSGWEGSAPATCWPFHGPQTFRSTWSQEPWLSPVVAWRCQAVGPGSRGPDRFDRFSPPWRPLAPEFFGGRSNRMPFIDYIFKSALVFHPQQRKRPGD